MTERRKLSYEEMGKAIRRARKRLYEKTFSAKKKAARRHKRWWKKKRLKEQKTNPEKFVTKKQFWVIVK